MDLDDEIIDLDKILKEGTELTSKIEENEEIIAIVGSTGSGKSTLLKFLLKDKALCIKENEQHEYFFADSDESNGIIGTDSFSSKTILPNIIQDEKSGCKIVDCAGFDDTRSSETDFVASIFNKEILNGSKKLKIVIVEDNDNLKLQGDRGSFMRVMQHISNLLKFNYKFFEISICLVANKIDSTKTDDVLIKSTMVFINKMREHLIAKMDVEDIEDQASIIRTRKILNFLVKRRRIGILRKPSKIEDPWMSESTENNWLALRKLIFEDVQFTTKINGEFNITVAPETLVWVNNSLFENTCEELKNSINNITKVLDAENKQLFDRVFDDIETKLKNDLYISNLIVSDLSSISSEKDIVDIFGAGHPEAFNEFYFIVQKLKYILKVIDTKRDQEVQDMITSLNGYRETEINHCNETIKYIKLITDLTEAAMSYEVRTRNEELLAHFRELNSENFKEKMTNLVKLGFNADLVNRAREQTIRWPSRVEDLRDYITEKNDSKFYTEWVDDCILLVRGRHLILSKLLTLFAQKQLVKQVVLAASQCIYIDCDLTLTHTHLMLIAPNVEIVHETRLITLKGENGRMHEATQAPSSTDDSPGEKGLDGNPGFSSGSFLLLSLDIRNPELLAIQSEGGDGSDGQQGGDGKSITARAFPKIEDIHHRCSSFKMDGYLSEFCDDYGFHNVIIVDEKDFNITTDFKTTPKKMFIIRIEIHPDEELIPTEGKDGGNAGSSAVAGEIELKVKSSLSKAQVEINRLNGSNGNPGLGGKGGIKRGKYKVIQCLFKTNLFKWTVQFLKDLEEGLCDCSLFSATNGNIGSPAIESQFPEYKFTGGLISDAEIIKDYFPFEKTDYVSEKEYTQFLEYIAALRAE